MPRTSTAIRAVPLLACLTLAGVVAAGEVDKPIPWDGEQLTWPEAYGSRDCKPGINYQERAVVTVRSAEIGADRRSLRIRTEALAPTMQGEIACRLRTAGGEPLDLQVHATLNEAPAP